MRAIQIRNLDGPDAALVVVELPDPEPGATFVGAEGVLVDVQAIGVSFPEVLQTRGQYQIKPPLPFVPGSEVAGTVRSAPEGSGFAAGDRVAAFCALGGFAEVVAAPPWMTFRLPDALSFAEGAALVLNYHTAYFALRTRGRLAEGETILIHGAAGGVGTASIQVARGLGATAIAVVSDDAKAEVAERAGTEHVLRTDDPWRDQAKELTGGGVHLVVDPVGGDRFTDSLRSLREGGRLVVVGFTGGSIPEVKVNRLLLNNTEIIGAGWGAYALPKPEYFTEVGAALDAMIEEGSVRPIVGQSFGFDEAAEALKAIDERRALGKVVLEL